MGNFLSETQNIEDVYDGYDDEYSETHTCQRCDGEGEIVVCMDDMCRGAGTCFHGDGMEICPVCHGEGEI